MKWLLSVFLAIGIIVLGIAILGGEICLSDGCCYQTLEEIQRATKTLLWLSHLWSALFGLMLFWLFNKFFFYIRKKYSR